MVAFTYRMPAGIPGFVSRADHATVDTVMGDPAKGFARYGMFGKTVSGLFIPLESGDAGSVVTGLNVRAYPTQSGTDPLGTSSPSATLPIDRLKRGYMTTTLKLGTAVKDAQAYVVTTAGGTVVVGDIVTSTSPAGGGTAVAVTGAFFTGPADASGNVEIAYNL